MEALSYVEWQARYGDVLADVSSYPAEATTARPEHPAVVIVSLDQCESLLETVYLIRSPANDRRLVNALQRLKRASRDIDPILSTD